MLTCGENLRFEVGESRKGDSQRQEDGVVLEGLWLNVCEMEGFFAC